MEFRPLGRQPLHGLPLRKGAILCSDTISRLNFPQQTSLQSQGYRKVENVGSFQTEEQEQDPVIHKRTRMLIKEGRDGGQRRTELGWG